MPLAAKNHISCHNPFRMISLRQIDPQLPSIDILTKKHGGWGGILPSYPTVAGRPDLRSFDGYGLHLEPVQYEYGLYLEPVQYGYGLYLEPVQYGCGLYLEPPQ